MVQQTPPERQKGDPEPLAIGTRVNLRREMPGTPAAERDKGWTVIGYTMKRSDKWLGYELQNEAGQITSASKFEALDILGG